MPTDWYWIGLSVWDSNGSYDQIGFGEYGGSWRFYFSYSFWDSSSNHHIIPSAPAILSLNTLYKFRMTISNEIVNYKLYKSSGSGWILQNSYVRESGGEFFIISNYIILYGHTFMNFQNFEEALPGSPAPPFDVIFDDTSIDGNLWIPWAVWYSNSPWGVTVFFWGWPFFIVAINNP